MIISFTYKIYFYYALLTHLIFILFNMLWTSFNIEWSKEIVKHNKSILPQWQSILSSFNKTAHSIFHKVTNQKKKTKLKSNQSTIRSSKREETKFRNYLTENIKKKLNTIETIMLTRNEKLNCYKTHQGDMVEKIYVVKHWIFNNSIPYWQREKLWLFHKLIVFFYFIIIWMLVAIII